MLRESIQNMTIKQFIREHRKEIDSVVKEYYEQTILNDTARHEWVLSDRGLYEWAQQEGVNI